MNLLPARSPLAALHSTIVLCILGSAALLFSLVFAFIDPLWSRAALTLQVVALITVLFAARWRPAGRLVLYPILLAGATYLWDPTLPPPSLPEGRTRGLLPLSIIVAIVADLLLLGHGMPLFAPKQIGVQDGLVELSEAAAFFQHDVVLLRQALEQQKLPILRRQDGAELVALADLLTIIRGSTSSEHH